MGALARFRTAGNAIRGHRQPRQCRWSQLAGFAVFKDCAPISRSSGSVDVTGAPYRWGSCVPTPTPTTKTERRPRRSAVRGTIAPLMNADIDLRELERTAWHEAGHALVCELLFGNVARITIEPDRDTLGRQSTSPTWCTPAFLRSVDNQRVAHAIARDGVRHCLAGQAAESIRFGRHRKQVDEDFLEAYEYISVIYPSDKVIDERNPPLSYHGVISIEWDRVRRWLQRHRAHLEAVVTALLTQRTLDRGGWEAVLIPLPRLQRPRWMIPSKDERGE